jgi:hypothetical protein
MAIVELMLCVFALWLITSIRQMGELQNRCVGQDRREFTRLKDLDNGHYPNRTTYLM